MLSRVMRRLPTIADDHPMKKSFHEDLDTLPKFCAILYDGQSELAGVLR